MTISALWDRFFWAFVLLVFAAIVWLWFFGESLAGGMHLGLAERTTAAAQNLWLFVVTLLAWRPR